MRGGVLFLVVGWFVPDVLLAGFFFVPAFVLIPLSAIVFLFILDATAKRIVFLVINMFLTQHISECMTWVFRVLSSTAESDIMWMVWSFITFSVVYAAVFFLVVFRKDTSVSNLKSWKLMTVSGGTFLTVYIFREVVRNLLVVNNINFPVIDITVNLYSALACVLLYILFYSVNSADSLVAEKQIMQELLRKEQDTYEMIAANLSSINYKCHDLKHQIAYLRDPLNTEEREAYIKQLEHDVMIYERMPKTGNVALDTTLANKCMYCERNDIEFVFLADAKALDFMEPTEIFSLVGNAIDNAIECVAKYDDPGKRQIAMRVANVGSLLRIYIENYCEDELDIRDGVIVTTKEDKTRHGFGMKSMRYIVEKYDGFMNVEHRGNLFVLTILFPMTEQET